MKEKKKISNWKGIVKQNAYDVLIDIISGIAIGVGVYNFAAEANFPLAGISGIALIFYQLYRLPIGMMTILLNVPIAILCFRTLGGRFFFRSVKTLIITSLIVDYVAPLFPVYTGDRMLSAVCCGIFTGIGYALVFANQSSTAGMDFVTLSVRAKKPHISLGKIIFIADMAVILAGGFLLKDVDGVIYGVIITYLSTMIIDRLSYGIASGKMTLIGSEKSREIVKAVEDCGRGATLLKGEGSYSGEEKDVVLCACNNKQMTEIRKRVKEIDPEAFTIIVESNEVIGNGFKESI